MRLLVPTLPAIELPDGPGPNRGSVYTYDGKHVDLDKLEEQVIKDNEPVLLAFKGWLIEQGYSAKTVRKHYDNVCLFASYLYFREPYLRLVQTTCQGVSFLDFYSHFLRSHVVGPKEDIMALPGSLKKLFHWMSDTGRMAEDEATCLIEEVRWGRKEDLELVLRLI